MNDFITNFERFGKALKHYQWIFNNGLIVTLILLPVLVILMKYAGITITVLTSLIYLIGKYVIH